MLARADAASQVKPRDHRALRYANPGEPVGKPLLYFQGNPGSRLEWCGEDYERWASTFTVIHSLGPRR